MRWGGRSCRSSSGGGAVRWWWGRGGGVRGGPGGGGRVRLRGRPGGGRRFTRFRLSTTLRRTAFVAGSDLSCLGRSGSNIRRGTGCSATTGGSCWGECGGVLRAVRRWDKDWEEGVGAGPSGGGGLLRAGAVFFFFLLKNFLYCNTGF